MRRTLTSVLLVASLAACGQSRLREPVTLVFLDIGPWHNREYAQWGQRALDDFARETGIAVTRLPAPEAADEQLVQRQLLEAPAPLRT